MRRVALRGAKTARAEDQIRHLMFSVVISDASSRVCTVGAKRVHLLAQINQRNLGSRSETTRVTSPTPCGVQKQNWRVRRLVSSRREPRRECLFLSGGTEIVGIGTGTGRRLVCRRQGQREKCRASDAYHTYSDALGWRVRKRTIQGAPPVGGRATRLWRRWLKSELEG